MIFYRCLLVVLVLLAVAGWTTGEQTGSEQSGPLDEVEYNPKCRPIEEFDQDQPQDARVKREEPVAKDANAEETDREIVAQPGYVVPANKRRLCLGRRQKFTEGCGPPARAYRVRNFVMAKNPSMKRRKFPNRIGQ
ncbi:uncharacterized protein LOC131294406 [Anopheles ziemanni]|uniref:uncharacterized protein LOC131265070 n=1 Tax=Anopheles coustani TaxID=139045 RepID=UPI0026596070|nr:uncharacterized protein LOC131265070 [Anopheles coustani]XP_058178437.1 uncharacterized protein LOC131294406 [Anopheles ziemanni]